MSSIGGNAAQFARDLIAEVKAAETKHHKLVGVAALTALDVAVQRSRVDTGAMRNTWQIVESVEAASERKEKVGSQGDGPSASQFARGQRVIQQAEPFATLYVVNPIEYSSFVDEDYPMVDPAVEAANAIINANRDAE